METKVNLSILRKVIDFLKSFDYTEFYTPSYLAGELKKIGLDTKVTKKGLYVNGITIFETKPDYGKKGIWIMNLEHALAYLFTGKRLTGPYFGRGRNYDYVIDCLELYYQNLCKLPNSAQALMNIKEPLFFKLRNKSLEEHSELRNNPEMMTGEEFWEEAIDSFYRRTSVTKEEELFSALLQVRDTETFPLSLSFKVKDNKKKTKV